MKKAKQDNLPDREELLTLVYHNNENCKIYNYFLVYKRGVEYDQSYFPEGKPY